jgi:hypothetical protein
MQKTEVYSWRLSPRLKNELAEQARAKHTSLAELLEEIAESWLRQAGAQDGDEAERQRRLHEAALPFVGAIDGGQPDRAETARDRLRSRLAHRHRSHEP